MFENSQSLRGFFVGEDVKNLYGWPGWSTNSGLPFSFVEQNLTGTYTKLKPISRTAFMKYLDLLTKQVESIISKDIPAKFGLIFDG